MPPATAYRLLNALVGDEDLVRTSDLRGFALGHAISDLVAAAAPPTVPTAARTVIEEFRRGNRFAVHLFMFRSASLRIADEDPDYPLHSVFELLRYPHTSAAGKLMLAELGDSVFPLPAGQLVKLTEQTITENGRLDEQLAEIRLTGQASEINEFESGSASLALPVRMPKGSAGGALCLTGSRRTVRHNLRARGCGPGTNITAIASPVLTGLMPPGRTGALGIRPSGWLPWPSTFGIGSIAGPI